MIMIMTDIKNLFKVYFFFQDLKLINDILLYNMPLNILPINQPLLLPFTPLTLQPNE